ncbi:Uu.00g128990.m01.CDS01 [Anthostomella pinea]|uniref:Uu.00g128990.m01.CDS01 n=1 Tax=Anthostomella pinea TaxID=933095 RepID=A0AAI8YHX8_9PEZI|nr:Uu.00g128990.m01.CDS01 [Anthostomella pinea]
MYLTVAFSSDKRDMTAEHVEQTFQSDFCDVGASEPFSESLVATERASVDDCHGLTAWLSANPGYYKATDFTGYTFNDLVTFGSCAFGFYRTDGGVGVFSLGNQDVLDLVGMAVRKYAVDGMVGAAGQVGCDGNTSISWSLYDVAKRDDGTMVHGDQAPA